MAKLETEGRRRVVPVMATASAYEVVVVAVAIIIVVVVIVVEHARVEHRAQRGGRRGRVLLVVGAAAAIKLGPEAGDLDVEGSLARLRGVEEAAKIDEVLLEVGQLERVDRGGRRGRGRSGGSRSGQLGRGRRLRGEEALEVLVLLLEGLALDLELIKLLALPGRSGGGGGARVGQSAASHPETGGDKSD